LCGSSGSIWELVGVALLHQSNNYHGRVEAYLIIYRRIKGMIEIVAITQGSRDIPVFVRRRLW
jgi:hypothetical protein